MLCLQWHIFIAHSLLGRKFASVNEHFLTYFPRGDVCAEKVTFQLFTRKMRQCKRATRKMCGAFTHTNKMCQIDAENVW